MLRGRQRVDGLLDVAVADLAHRAEQRLFLGDARARREHVGDVEQHRRDAEAFGARRAACGRAHERAEDQQARAGADADRTGDAERARLVAAMSDQPEQREPGRRELHDAVHARRVVTNEVGAPVTGGDQHRDQRELVVHGYDGDST